MSESTSLLDARARRVLERMIDGDLTVSQARQMLWGIPCNEGPARLIKEGRWASVGNYETGETGAIRAAWAALHA